MKELWQLFSAFARIGALTFGGGYAMLPMLEKEVVERHGWASREELLDYFAIGQATPGIIAVNTATLVGYKRRRIPGAAVATLGVVAPSIIIILAIAAVLSNFAHIAAVQHAFAGIRVAVCALIVAAVVKLVRSNVLRKAAPGQPTGAGAFFKRNGLAMALCVAGFVVVAVLGASPVWVVVGAALVGLVFYGKRGEG